jgi:hypothetical protein
MTIEARGHPSGRISLALRRRYRLSSLVTSKRSLELHLEAPKAIPQIVHEDVTGDPVVALQLAWQEVRICPQAHETTIRLPCFEVPHADPSQPARRAS